MEGAAGPLWRVEHAAYVRGAGGSGGGGRSQRCAGGVGGGHSPALGLAVRDAAVTDLPRLVLQRRRVAHGTRPRRGGTDPWRLQRTGVLLHLHRGRGTGGSTGRGGGVGFQSEALVKVVSDFNSDNFLF